MKIVTWNVNSVRTRRERVCRFLNRERPDALCLQELKASDEDFPREAFTELGYHAAVYGQKTYNGVAILTPTEPAEVLRGFGPADEDPQSRLISARIGAVRVLSAYFPNGKTVGSDKWEYKLDWMRRLLEYLETTASPDEPLALTGDFNVAPDDADAANPEKWADSVLCHEDARAALEALAAWGLTDACRPHWPEGGVYSWWDYRMLGFPKNDGLRIDHVFVTAPLVDRCTDARVDRNERKGTKDDKPSDHAPVIAEFDV